jgi:V/A-type H+-transporting ATPase subunit I
MKFVSIVGKIDHFDKFVSNYIIDSNLHPENALSVITLVRGIMPFSNDESKSDFLLKSCVSLLDFLQLDYSPPKLEKYYNRNFIPIDEIEQRFEDIDRLYRANRAEYDGAEERLKDCALMKASLENILSVNVNVEQFFDLEFVKFRFGKVPKEALKPLEIWAEELDMIMIPMSSDERSCWLIYFTPTASSEKVDGIVSSMQFERTRLPAELTGTPLDALGVINRTIGELSARIVTLQAELAALKEQNVDALLHMYYSLARISRNHEVRRNAGRTESSFYICGWIPEEDLAELARAIEQEESDTFVEEEPSLIRNIKPPTELKNPGVFKFFEVLVKMYGLPAYEEIDPTVFVAITYFLLFGIMFGDVGQGLVILLLGLVLMRRKFALAGIFTCVGVSSTIFGFIYGSLFGDEEIIPQLLGRLFGTPGHALHLIRPMEDTTSLLIGGVVIGVLIMLAATVLNIINGLREKNLGRVLFDRNGAAGTLFYWTILIAAAYYVTQGEYILPVAVLALLVGGSFLAIFFKEPIERLIEKKSFLPKEDRGMFFVQGIFEMVDMLLSMASNTLSFLRVGAFALNHAGLFMAFNILARMAGRTGGVFVSIFANVLIIGLEGLIVGIQCMRLEYYELFSRFFKGDGKTYRPLRRSIL